jgi:hypothetical protein
MSEQKEPGIKRRTMAQVGAGVVVLLLVLLSCVLVLPSYLAKRDLGRYGGTALTQAEYLKARNDVRTTLLQGFGGLLVLLGAGIGATVGLRQIKVSQGQLQATRDQIRQSAEQNEKQLQLSRDQLQQNFDANQRQLETSREGQITERFTNAIDQLGSEKLEIKLGGIYALERIAKDSPGDRAAIADVLTAFVREHSPWPARSTKQTGEVSADIQAVMTVLGRRDEPSESKGSLDLSKVDLRNAFLAYGNLERAYLVNVNLSDASLFCANLREANLTGAQLKTADLGYVNLEQARLDNTDLQDIRIYRANLKGASLRSANLKGARLIDEANLEGAKANSKTQWPRGFNPEDAGVIFYDDQDEGLVH